MRLRYLIILFLPSFAVAQITHRDLLQKDCPPSRLKMILVSRADFQPFPRTQEEWRKFLPDSIIAYLLQNGENALKHELPNIPASTILDFVRNGNRTRYESLSFLKRNLLWNLLLAESIERKGRFMNAIVDEIWSICEETFWGATAHLFIQKAGKGLPDVEDPVVDLFAAETAANLAFADYFVGPQLDSISPLLRRRIYYEVNRRVFVPLQTAKYEWMGKGDKNAKLNNWAPWIMSNYLTAVLFLENSPQKRIQFVSRAIQITDQYINGIGDDGASEEGPHYWSFGAGCVFDVLNLLTVATNNRVNLYRQPLIQKMGDYIYKTHIAGNYFINVADSHPEEFPGPILVYRFGQETGDDDLTAFGSWLFKRQPYANMISTMFHRARVLFDMKFFRVVGADTKTFRVSTGVFLNSVQLWSSRLSNGLFIAAHGGNNGESHNHNDVGDFIIYANGDPVIIDVGSGTYTARTFSADRYKLWFNTSAYHNLPTVNSQPQSEGAAFGAGKVTWKKVAGGDELSMDIHGAYPAAAGLALWRRTIAAGDQSIIIVDSFKARAAVSVEQSFMTVCSTDISQEGKIIFTTAHGNSVELNYGAEWMISKEIIPLVTEEDQGLKSTWHDQPITRILLKARSPRNEGKFVYSIAIDRKTK